MGDQPSFIADVSSPLTPEIPPRPSYPRRIQRAHELAECYSTAAELLRFYGRLAFQQQRVFESLSSGRVEASAESWPLLLDRLLPLLPDFALALAESAPSPMRERAAQIAASPSVAQVALLASLWNGGPSRDSGDEEWRTLPDRFVALAFLQPYAEWLAKERRAPKEGAHHATCPICSSEPLCAVLRDQDHGARRDLVCSLCLHEWVFPRLTCPGCGENRFELLPIFTPEETPHVRLDVCDTCKHYIKTVDLTKNGLAIPVVDELAAVSLDLWAREHGYVKLSRNLAGL